MLAKGNGKSVKGLEREVNEDYLHVDNKLGLYILSDGMGGRACGELAAITTAETIVEHISKQATLVKEIRNGSAPSQAAVQLRPLYVQGPSRCPLPVSVTDYVPRLRPD